MASETLTVVSARCCRSGHDVRWKDVVRANGVCSECGGDRFDVTVRHAISNLGIEAPDAASMVTAVVLDMPLFAAPRIESGQGEIDHELVNIVAAELMHRLENPAGAAAWIQHLRKETAKANLREGQTVCPVCDSIFNVGFAGHTSRGYCSKLCEKKAQRKAGR